MQDFEKVIRPATVPVLNSHGNPTRVMLWIKIQYTDGCLSITGVEGPKSDGDCYGSCWQCGVHPKAGPMEGYTLEMLERLRQVWAEWRLNDMRPYSAEMKAAGWHKLAKRKALGYEYERTSTASREKRAAEKAALDAARAGQTFTPTAEQIVALQRPLDTTIWTLDGEPEPETPEGMKRLTDQSWANKGGIKPPKTKTLGWLYPHEHPAGLLGRKLNPEDKHGYGEKWWFEAVPEDVLEWLYNLPEPKDGVKPAWV